MPLTGRFRQGAKLGKAEGKRRARVRHWSNTQGHFRPVCRRFGAAYPVTRIFAATARKAVINGISTRFYTFIKNLRLRPMIGGSHRDRIAALTLVLTTALEFQSANPTIIKSIRQRDLLNTWLRLYACEQEIPRLDEYQPARLADELQDLVYYTVDTQQTPPRLTIQSDGTRMSSAYGNTGKGRYLDEYIGARLIPVVMPVYYQCVTCALPVYTISNVDDSYGRIVAYERLLLPFSDGGEVTHVIASLKTISDDGAFEIRNLMRGNDKLPVTKLRAVIDRDLFHRAPGRIPAGDVIEFS
jgi:hypothetical protein